MLEEPALYGSTYILERRINQPTDVVARILRDRSTVAPAKGFALDDGGTLLIEDTPRSSPPISAGQETWRTTARLLSDRGRLVSRLDIEVSAWAPGSVIIQLRPIGTRPERWGTRRTRRYFTLAHAGADRLERLLNEAPAAGAMGGPPDSRLSGLTVHAIATA